MIRNAVIITDNGEESTVVTLGKTVTFKELPDGDEEAYTIVGSAEADPFEGRISNDSPIAKSLLGKQIGEKVAIQTPGGEMQVEIISVIKRFSYRENLFSVEFYVTFRVIRQKMSKNTLSFDIIIRDYRF